MRKQNKQQPRNTVPPDWIWQPRLKEEQKRLEPPGERETTHLEKNRSSKLKITRQTRTVFSEETKDTRLSRKKRNNTKKDIRFTWNKTNAKMGRKKKNTTR